MKRRLSVSLCLMLASLSGCITDATTELTKAPFDAITDLTDGTTNATSEFTQPVKEFTSSTTPGSWFTGNNPAKARQKLEVFAAYAYENLRSDIARGDGEYLVSLAALAGVPQEQQPVFQLQMRNAYAMMFDEAIPPRESSARLVEAAWSAGIRSTERRGS